MRGAGGILIKICIMGYLCQLYSGDICSRNPCQNGGYCKLQNGVNSSCVCPHGWSGTFCEQNVNDCNPNPCFNGGECIDKENSAYDCVCTKNFTGNKCQFENPCLTHSCFNGGVCVPLLDGKSICRCLSHFKGTNCTLRAYSCPKESKSMCNNHGECEYSNEGRPYCKCDDHYYGANCELKITKMIDIGCKDDFCMNGGLCTIQDNGSPLCKCPTKYGGDRCDVLRGNSNNVPALNLIKTVISTSSCQTECQPLRGNGICEQRCNTDKCQYDGGDCDPWKKCVGQRVVHCRDVFRNSKCNPECNNVDCLFDGQDCERSPCFNKQKCSRVYQNGICNDECNNPQCGFDGGDCSNQQSDSFFSETHNVQQCSANSKEFELDLILLTTKESFLRNKSSFLQSLGSALKMVLTIANITEITFNSTAALSIKLKINPSECVIYGGQCFSSLDQISNFLKAGIIGHGALSLPFKVANVASKTVYSEISKKTQFSSYFVAVIAMCLALTISLIVIGVLLRDKWGRLRTTVKTAGVWTPSEGYSTSTSSINSNHKTGWPGMLQPHSVKLDNRNHDNDVFRFDQLRQSRLEKEFDGVADVTNRKRKYEIVDDKALSFQCISDNLQKRDGVNPVEPTKTKLLSIINENVHGRNDSRYANPAEESTNIGAYVNDSGESLLHVASRMNCGANIIKKLHNISPGMLHSTDEWGRTPIATAVASDSYESAEQLLLLEKQSRKESKQNKARSGQNSLSTFGTMDNPVKKTTGLIESVKLNSKDMINLLLDEGSPVNVLDSVGRSVVHWAAMFDNVALLERLSHMKIFQKLVDLKDNEELSPLYLAASEGSYESAKFIVEYISKLGIKIDPIYPSPESIAAEKGFNAIEVLIREVQLPGVYSEKAYKRMKLKDQRLHKKMSTPNSPQRHFGMINEYQEYSADSLKPDKNSPSGLDSIDSCLLDMYSQEDSSLNNILDSCSNDRNNYSSFKPHDNTCYGYLSNTSSSDMSPPLLNLNNTAILNGYNFHSDQLDPTLQNAFFLCPNNISNKSKNDDHHLVDSNPTLDLYRHPPITIPSINCQF